MVLIPNIVDYKPFYIQTSADDVARDTTEWGLIAKVNPYPLLPNPKEPYANDWSDENGDDEYCDQMYFESIEFSVSFCIMATDTPGGSAEEIIRESVQEFFDKIKSGYFRTYDSYNGIGRQKVRYAGYKEEEFVRRGEKARAVFEITFKTNDPITRMVMYDGSIVEG